MPVTVRDIARRLNIGKTTVGYALNGGPKPVSEEVRRLVLQTAQEMGYRPNENARALANGHTNIIGVVPFQLDRGALASPFIRTALNAIYDAAEDAGRHVLLFTGYDPRNVEAMRARSFEARVDAVVLIAPKIKDAMQDFMAELKLPLAVIAGPAKGPGVTFNADNASGVRQAIKHLQDLGHSRIGTISGNVVAGDSRERNIAIEAEFEVAHLIRHAEWAQQGDFTVESGYTAAMRMLRSQNRPTAIFTANDLMALGVLRAARELSLRVPEDLSVIGFDDDELSVHAVPALTTVRQPISAMATAALEAVVLMLHGHPASNLVFPTELIQRASTASPREDFSI